MRRLWWLWPGLGFKRWFILSLTGILMVVIGIFQLAGAALLELVQVLPLALGGLLLVLGIILAVGSLAQVARALFQELMQPGGSLFRRLYRRRLLARGPRIVVLGGGTGLGVMLRGLKEYTSNLTAIVTVSDDGGSSGRLRGEMGVLPPGDLRSCLVALAETEGLMERLLNYRFYQGKGLAGHNLGNLLLVALAEISGGWDRAIQDLSQVLAVQGQVLPATLSSVTLEAELDSGQVVRGETAITAAGKPITSLRLIPNDCKPLPEAIAAIREADAVILGPGSLYTSILPNLLVPEICQALAVTRARVIYVCNIMTQPGETSYFTASEHLRVIHQHCGPHLVDTMLVNKQPIPPTVLQNYAAQGAHPVMLDARVVARMGVRLVMADLVDPQQVVRHHPAKLARLLLQQLKTGHDRIKTCQTN